VKAETFVRLTINHWARMIKPDKKWQ